MKNILIFLFILSSIIATKAQANPPIQTEELNYTIYIKAGFIWIAIGEMNITTTEDPKNTSIHLSAKSFKKWRHLHELQVDIKSVLSNDTGLSTSYVRHSIENGIMIKDSIEFDQANLNALEIITENNDESKTYSVALKNNVVDILTSFHSMRSEFGKKNNNEKLMQYALFYNRLQYDFGFTFQKRENKKIKKIGKRNCALITAQAITGRFFKNENKLKIWLSDDEQSKPLMFESPLKLGKIRIVINNES